ncbi:MAG: O-antigen polymerase [Candidatus Limnocylindrales bacterium]
MTGPVIAFVGLAMVSALILAAPAARRTGLGPWHPAMAWLVLEIVFFGIGSTVLAIADGRTGPALYVGAAVLVFALAVWASERLARRRVEDAPPTVAGVGQAAPIRPLAVIALALLGGLALLPTLLNVGIPFLAGDITGARIEVGGLDLQLLRVTLPAAVLVTVLGAVRTAGRKARLVAVAAIVIAVAAELALASRYLAAELAAAIVLGLAIGRRPIPGRVLAVVGLGVAVLFVGIGILRAYDRAAGREVAFGVERTINRILLVEPRTLDALQAAIPAERPFFDGLTWLRRVAPLVGRDDVPNLGYWIYPRLFPAQATPGYAAPGLMGEAWANFGWLGLSVFALLGLLVERLGALLALRRRAVADVAAAALLTLFVARTHALGLNGLAVVVAIVTVWRVLVAPVDGLARDVRMAASWRT